MPERGESHTYFHGTNRCNNFDHFGISYLSDLPLLLSRPGYPTGPTGNDLGKGGIQALDHSCGSKNLSSWTVFSMKSSASRTSDLKSSPRGRPPLWTVAMAGGLSSKNASHRNLFSHGNRIR